MTSNSRILLSKTSGKRVYLDPATGRVWKRARTNAVPGRLEHQSHHLERMRRLGLPAPEVFEDGSKGWAVHQYIPGPTLLEVVVAGITEEQKQALLQLQQLQERLRVYVSDLHHKNLVWGPDSRWWIIDGSLREGRSHEKVSLRLAEQRAKWGVVV